jgi:hypothetical protein
VSSLSDEGLRRLVKEDLLSMIIDAGLLEEFIGWLRRKMGGHIDPVKIDNIEIRYMVEFLREKNLLSSDPIPMDLDVDDKLEKEVERSMRNAGERRTRRYKPT